MFKFQDTIKYKLFFIKQYHIILDFIVQYLVKNE